MSETTFLDPACGSGHFLIEAFDLYYDMYVEEGELTEPAQIVDSILANNLFGIDIDERAVQLAEMALVMKAKERAPCFTPCSLNLAATNICLPEGAGQLEAFLRKHPDDRLLEPALKTILHSLQHADEIGSLLRSKNRSCTNSARFARRSWPGRLSLKPSSSWRCSRQIGRPHRPSCPWAWRAGKRGNHGR